MLWSIGSTCRDAEERREIPDDFLVQFKETHCDDVSQSGMHTQITRPILERFLRFFYAHTTSIPSP